MVALSGLKEKLDEMHKYLQHILDGRLPVNNQVSVLVPPSPSCKSWATSVVMIIMALYLFPTDCVQFANHLQPPA